jgi:hypothetical protein
VCIVSTHEPQNVLKFSCYRSYLQVLAPAELIDSKNILSYKAWILLLYPSNMAVLHPNLPITQDSSHCRKQTSEEVPFLRAEKVYNRR